MRLAVVFALVVGVLVLAATALAHEPVKGSHLGTGIVTAFSGSLVTMKEGAHVHRLTVTPSTRIVIGTEHAVAGLGVGDYIAEECVPDGKGGLRAIRLTLYRPAWMELTSPEQ